MACSSAEQVEMRLKIFSERESATIPSCYLVSFVVKILLFSPWNSVDPARPLWLRSFHPCRSNKPATAATAMITGSGTFHRKSTARLTTAITTVGKS